ncbi:MAG: DUF3237 domain-containing protein [Myxococcota bacterium]|nr:DUF3237 domain-containing protein [Myxococcota bacterium]
MAETSLPVRHLYKVTLEIGGAPITLPAGPQGTRMMVGVKGGHFEGDRLKGKVVEPGGDWVTQRADGSIKVDVRVILQTDDGAHILVTYNGIGIVTEGKLSTRCAPLFETGDERYAWLNNIQAVGIGRMEGKSVFYDIYELL